MGKPANLRVNILGDSGDLIRAIKAAGDEIRGFEQTSKNATDQSGKGASAASKFVTGLAVAWTGAAVTAGTFATKVFKTGFAYNTLQQTARAAFETVLGSAAAAEQMMGKLDKFAKTSPFPKDAFIRATQQMIGFGISADKVVPILGAVQDAVAATGGGAAEIEGIVDVLSKVQSSGKITAETLNQLGTRGIDAATIIGSQMGKTGDEIRSAITSGSLDAEEAIDALTKGMAEKFDGAAARVKQTWTGATDRIKSALRDIGSLMAEPFNSSAGGGLAIEWANGIADTLRGIEPIVGSVVERIVSSLPIFDGIGAVIDKIAGGAERLGAAFEAGKLDLSAWEGLGPALGAITGAFGAVAAGAAGALPFLSKIPILGGALGALGGPIGITVAAIAGLVAFSPELQSVFGEILMGTLSALQPLLQVAAELMAQLGGVIAEVLGAAAPIVQQLGEIFVQFLSQAIIAAAPFIQQLGTVVISLIQSALVPLLPVLGQMLTAFMPVISAVTQLIPPIMQLLSPIIALIGPIVQLALTAATPLLRILTPLIPVIAQVIGAAVQLLGPIIALISPILQLASGALSWLLGILTAVIQQGFNALAPAISAVQGAFSWLGGVISGVIGWFSNLLGWIGRVLSPLREVGNFLGGIFGGGGGGGRGRSLPSGFTIMHETDDPAALYDPAAYAARVGRSFSASVVRQDVRITVNAPYGGGDAIARAIRAELTKLDRRNRGVILGAPA